MRIGTAAWLGTGAVALVISLLAAPAVFAQSAVDQYSEAIPTAGGQKPSHDAATGRDRGTAAIPPQTSAELQKSKTGAAAEKTARLTAPTKPSASAAATKSSSPSAGGSASDSGMGLFLPLILGASLIGVIAIFVARRRAGAPAG